MKNLVYALVGAGFMIACQPSEPETISGNRESRYIIGMLTGYREYDTWKFCFYWFENLKSKRSFLYVNDRDSRRTDTKIDCHAKMEVFAFFNVKFYYFSNSR